MDWKIGHSIHTIEPLAKICIAFHCEITDILEYIPPEK